MLMVQLFEMIVKQNISEQNGNLVFNQIEPWKLFQTYTQKTGSTIQGNNERRKMQIKRFITGRERRTTNCQFQSRVWRSTSRAELVDIAAGCPPGLMRGGNKYLMRSPSHRK